MKKNPRTQYQYKIVVSNYPKELNTSEYIVNGDDVMYTDFDDGQTQMSIMLNKKTVFSCHMSRVIECYREDVLIDYINNEKDNKSTIKFNRDKNNNLIILDIKNKGSNV